MVSVSLEPAEAAAEVDDALDAAEDAEPEAEAEADDEPPDEPHPARATKPKAPVAPRKPLRDTTRFAMFAPLSDADGVIDFQYVTL